MKKNNTVIELTVNQPKSAIAEMKPNAEAKNRLAQLEATIKNGLVAFVEVGKALREIQETKLYKIYLLTFEDYCQKHLGISYRRVVQLIAAAGVVENLINCSEKSEQLVQANLNKFSESAVRPMTKLKPEIQILVWNKLTANGEIPKPCEIRAEVQRTIIAEEIITKHSLTVKLEEIIQN